MVCSSRRAGELRVNAHRWRNKKGSQISIQGRTRTHTIPDNGAPEGTEQLHRATATSGDGVGEADGAHPSAGGENEAEKGLDCVSPTPTGDLDDVGWGEGSVWGVFFDHDGEFRADGRRTGS